MHSAGSIRQLNHFGTFEDLSASVAVSELSVPVPQRLVVSFLGGPMTNLDHGIPDTRWSVPAYREPSQGTPLVSGSVGRVS